MKGRCLNRLTMEPYYYPLTKIIILHMTIPFETILEYHLPYGFRYSFPTAAPATDFTPRVGLEPTTTRLTAECSTIELSRIISFFSEGCLLLQTIPHLLPCALMILLLLSGLCLQNRTLNILQSDSSIFLPVLFPSRHFHFHNLVVSSCLFPG